MIKKSDTINLYFASGLKRSLLSLFVAIFTLAYTNSASSADSWQKFLGTHFDIVETFDSYEDWTVEAKNDRCGKGMPGSNLFKRVCAWNRKQGLCGKPRPVAITDHGKSKRVTGKSFRLSHAGNGNRCGEANGVLVFFGKKGDQDSGYMELFLFFRAYLPATLFPTYHWDDINHTKYCMDDNSKSKPVVCHVKGKDYAYTDSWKWIAFSLGFSNAGTFGQNIRASGGSGNCRYGIDEIHSHIKCMKRDKYHLTIGLMKVGRSKGNLIPYLGKLCAFEFRLKRETSINSKNGEAQIWIYDEDGNCEEILNRKGINFIDPKARCLRENPGVDVTNMKFNRLQIEGNKRVPKHRNFSCGNVYDHQGNITGEMECEWYLDDFIINDKRVGLRYFKLLKARSND